ncbi:hypothetical protein [Mycolicibacterium psychrotolerans]|uniref:Keratin associated protein n=1 Tax=Mycolicibacterium psychrotolerans TaxID=216929 RepID=A0A7I7MF42_9MYCO|nr:hypothetical protein [Mycolicibacterium psychrotolerans]BBX70666.1 hypothetical protein MPSYJ_41270 [Mycolicibacterium psychrotolerans]
MHRPLIAPLVAAGVAAAIFSAPTALAADGSSNCTYSGDGSSLCQSPGNAQLATAPPDVPYQPWSYYPYGGNLIVLGGHPHHGR